MSVHQLVSDAIVMTGSEQEADLDGVEDDGDAEAEK